MSHAADDKMLSNYGFLVWGPVPIRPENAAPLRIGTD